MARQTRNPVVLQQIQDMKDKTHEFADSLTDAAVTDVNMAGRVILDTPNMTYLAQKLPFSAALRQLALGYTMIRDDQLLLLTDCLGSHPTLQQLRLTGNHIQDRGAHALADMLAQNSTLQYLDLNDNKITAAGACAIASVLEDHNRSLTALHISFNDIHIQGAEALGLALLFNDSISVLSIHGNSIGDCECSYCRTLGRGDVLGDLVATSTSLVKLDIGGNLLERGTRIQIARCLAANPALALEQLVGVDLRDCCAPLHFVGEMRQWKHKRLLCYMREHPDIIEVAAMQEKLDDRRQERIAAKVVIAERKREAGETEGMAVADEESLEMRPLWRGIEAKICARLRSANADAQLAVEQQRRKIERTRARGAIGLDLLEKELEPMVRKADRLAAEAGYYQRHMESVNAEYAEQQARLAAIEAEAQALRDAAAAEAAAKVAAQAAADADAIAEAAAATVAAGGEGEGVDVGAGGEEKGEDGQDDAEAVPAAVLSPVAAATARRRSEAASRRSGSVVSGAGAGAGAGV